MKKWKLIFMAALALVGALLPTACANAAPEKLTVILDWYPNTNHTGLYVALDKGYFSDLGLDVTIQQPGDTLDSLQMVAAGSAQFGVSYQENVTYSLTSGTPPPVQAIGAILQHNTSSFSSPVSKGIATPADFAGKTYGGYGAPVEQAVIWALCDKYGVARDSVKIVDLGMSDFFAAVQGDVDFSWIYLGWTDIEAQQRGIQLNNILLSDEDPRLDYYTPVIVGNTDFMSAHPDVASKFMRAVSEGYDYCVSNPDDAAQILCKYAPDLDSTVVRLSQEFLADKYIADAPQFGWMDQSRWDALSDFMVQYDVIPRALDSSIAFTDKYLPARTGTSGT